MKNSIKLLTGLLLFSTLFTGCGDDDDNDTVVITVDDAAEYLAASMAVATYGAVYNMNYVAGEIIELLDCNESDGDTRSVQEDSPNGEIMVDFTISESYSRTCDETTERVTYNFNTGQVTTSIRLNSDTGIAGAWTIDGVESSSTAYIYNGSYSSGGEWTYNLQDGHTDMVNVSYVYNDVKSNKEDNVIFEGTATFSLSGSSTVYEPFDYEGNIVFQDNNICIATFDSGEQYEIDLNSGEVTPL